MTQSYNLSQLANNLNTAGQLDATDGLVGAVPPANGGTGLAAYAVGDLLYASGATALARLADVATGSALITGGVGVAPTYGKIGLATHVNGTLGVANGGTGAATLTANNVLLGNGTGVLQAVAPSTSGNVLVSNGTTWVSGSASQVVQTRVLVSGTTYTSPAGVKAIRVFVSGATGGKSSTATATGGCGGAGWSEKYIVSPAATYTYAVGAGGTSAGSAGGTTTFSTISITSGSGIASTTTGAAGGVATGGDFNANGGSGGNGSPGGGGGGGGGAASRAGAGGNGATAVYAYGGGGGGTGGNSATGQTGGIAATTVAAGAGGIPNWDTSAPISFSAGNNGATTVSCCATVYGGIGGAGAGNTETTGYVAQRPTGAASIGGNGVNYSIQAAGTSGQIVVWEYM